MELMELMGILARRGFSPRGADDSGDRQADGNSSMTQSTMGETRKYTQQNAQIPLGNSTECIGQLE